MSHDFQQEIPPEFVDNELLLLLEEERTNSLASEYVGMLIRGEISSAEYDLRNDILAMDEDAARRRLNQAQRMARPSWLGRIMYGRGPLSA